MGILPPPSPSPALPTSANPLERHNRAGDPVLAEIEARLRVLAEAKGDLARFDAEVRASQARRHAVYPALRNGACYPPGISSRGRGPPSTTCAITSTSTIWKTTAAIPVVSEGRRPAKVRGRAAPAVGRAMKGIARLLRYVINSHTYVPRLRRKHTKEV
ncbi:hypothetical protein QOZ99_003045 [Angulomicrobium amanitiforme]|uniref:Transposase n=1 Tax=Ancylobacter amanitiformis TaxID=217069 RepID=A0ABU0LU56_9HYPH|nr:hypothetical protein [Ancylobacter amanitiformis]